MKKHNSNEIKIYKIQNTILTAIYFEKLLENWQPVKNFTFSTVLCVCEPNTFPNETT